MSEHERVIRYVIAGYKTGREGNVHPSGELVEASDVVFESEVVFEYGSALERQGCELVLLSEITRSLFEGADLVMIAKKSGEDKE